MYSPVTEIKKAILLAMKMAIGKATFLEAFIMPKQELVQGAGSSAQMPSVLSKYNVSHPLIVTDAVLMKLGVTKKMLDALDAAGVKYSIYDGVEPNPTIANVDAAFAQYKENNCDCIIGFGGGSAMDTAKTVGARSVKPNLDTKQLGGYFKLMIPVPKRVPVTVTVPTTAGTGAETTVASVISDHETDRKYTVNDFMLRPHVAVLDPELAMGLPAYPTACTAIDALSHCVEGYVGFAHNDKTDNWAEQAVRMIFENIDKATAKGSDLEARGKLCLAAYYGGLCLDFSITGYVHPFCHKIGAKYGLVHGRCIGAVLPIILDAYGEKVYPRLARLATVTGVMPENGTDEQKAKAFIQKIRDFDTQYGIGLTIPELSEADFEEIYKSIDKENLIYPTPAVFSRDEVYGLLKKIKYGA